MALLGALTNVRYWIVAGIICAFLFNSIGDITSTVLIIVLIIQMSLSMDGLSIKKNDLKEKSIDIICCLMACFVIGSSSAIIMGFLFLPYLPDLWGGWIMLAAVPSAISVITFALYQKGDMTLSVLGTTVVYLCALAVTPLITFIFAGDAVDPLQILRSVLLFIVVPLVTTIPLKKLHLNRNVKVIGINMMMFAMVMLSVGLNKDYFFTEPFTVLLIMTACFIRIFIVSLIMFFVMKKTRVKRDSAFIILGMGVWKNSGLAVTLCVMLLSDTPEAVLPCVISLLMETIWFATMSGYFSKNWPHSTEETTNLNPIE